MRPKHCAISKHAVLRFLERIDSDRRPEQIKAELKHNLQQVRVRAGAPAGASWDVPCRVAGHPVKMAVVWHPDQKTLVAVTVIGQEASA